jgi:hypothetical protein
MRAIAMTLMFGLAFGAGLLGAEDDCSSVRSDVSRLEGEVRSLRDKIGEKEGVIRTMTDEAQATSREVAELRGRLETLVAGPFLASPPPGSDTAGVAKHAVFAPQIDVDLAQRHDLFSFVLRRIGPIDVSTLASFDLVSDQDKVAVPIDRNGALYVLDWVTSEGYNSTLVLRDGATGQAAATVQIRPQQRSGRFIFVGYNVE